MALSFQRRTSTCSYFRRFLSLAFTLGIYTTEDDDDDDDDDDGNNNNYYYNNNNNNSNNAFTN